MADRHMQRIDDDVDGQGRIAETVEVSVAEPLPAVLPLDAVRPAAHGIDAFLASVERRAWRTAEIALNDADEALDAVQDSMLRLVRHYGDKPAAEWSPLFWGILRRRITDLQRRRSVRNRILMWTGRMQLDETGEELPAWEAADPGPDPARMLSARQAYTAMSTAIRKLPRRQQEAFLLRVLEGLDVADTAHAMGCSEGSVKTHLSRALAALRGQLEAWR